MARTIIKKACARSAVIRQPDKLQQTTTTTTTGQEVSSGSHRRKQTSCALNLALGSSLAEVARDARLLLAANKKVNNLVNIYILLQLSLCRSVWIFGGSFVSSGVFAARLQSVGCSAESDWTLKCNSRPSISMGAHVLTLLGLVLADMST